MKPVQNLGNLTDPVKKGQCFKRQQLPPGAPRRRQGSHQSPDGRNWRAVDVRAITRGDFTEAFGDIRNLFTRVNTGNGRPIINPELVLMLLVGAASLNLSLRAAEGLGRTLARAAGVDPNLAPDHSTLCRYMNEDKFKQLKTLLATIHTFHKPTKLYLAVDSTGLSKRKSGGWRQDKPGSKDIRKGKYAKLHIAVDTPTGHIIAWSLTDAYGDGSGDPKAILPVLETISGCFQTVVADGAYDSKDVFDLVEAKGGTLNTPLSEKARYSNKGHVDEYGRKILEPTARDHLLKQQRHYGLKEFKQKSGYHQRSLVETVFSVTEQHWGNRLRTRVTDHQNSEMELKMTAYNHAINRGLKEMGVR